MNLTILQRLLAETSPFFKKVQIVLVPLLLIINGLSDFIPANYLLIINTAGVTILIFCSLTVSDAKLFSNGFSLSALGDLLQQLASQITEIKDGLAGKITVQQAITETQDPATTTTTTEVKAEATPAETTSTTEPAA